VSGLPGPYLVRARVTRGEVPITRGAIPPPPPPAAGAAVAGPRSQQLGKDSPPPAKGLRAGRIQPMPGRAKVQDQSAGRQGKPASILFFESPRARARGKGRLEAFESQTKSAMIGTGKRDRNSQWSRTQETAGP
jgi:hypothetical protein